jgi:hypothetical protein
LVGLEVEQQVDLWLAPVNSIEMLFDLLKRIWGKMNNMSWRERNDGNGK